MNVVRIALVTALVMLVVSSVSWSGRSGDQGDEATALVATAVTSTAGPATPVGASTSTPTVTATETAAASVAPSGLPVASNAVSAASSPAASAGGGRLVVPRIGVDAPIVTLGLREDGTMPAPSGPTQVASYTFAAAAGQTGNFVLAGHVDFANYGPAVFYRLRELRAGDAVFVRGDDGSQFEYRVVWVAAYEEATAPIEEILGPTSTASATLITCAGTFSAAAHAYDGRLVVRAERVA